MTSTDALASSARLTHLGQPSKCSSRGKGGFVYTARRASQGIWKPGLLNFGETPLPANSKPKTLAPYLLFFVPELPIFSVRKIFVEELEGNAPGMMREQLMALIANSRRFTLVDSWEKADAVLTGRSDSRDIGEKYGSTERTSKGVAAASVLGVGVAGARATSTAKGAMETIISERAVLRLVLPSGETLWAWGDTEECSQAKAKCIIEGLTMAAIPAVDVAAKR